MKKISLLLLVVLLINLLPISATAADHNPYTGLIGIEADVLSANMTKTTASATSPQSSGDYILFKKVNFGTNGAYRVDATLGALLNTSTYLGGRAELRLDAQNGKTIASFKTTTEKNQVYSANLDEAITGVHDVYVVFFDKSVKFSKLTFQEYAEGSQELASYKEPDYLKDIKNYGKKDLIYTLIELGLIEPFMISEYNPELGITRGEFSKVMAKIMGVGEADVGESIFSDVDPASEYAASINFLQSLGIVRGTNDGKYNPGVYITVIDAITMAVRALGYENMAIARNEGYPEGYLNMASKLGLTKGMMSQKELTRGDLAILVNNMINAEYLEVTGLAGNYEQNIQVKGILSKTLSYYKGRGKVSANSFTTLAAPVQAVPDNAVLINGEIYYVGNTYAASLIGYDTEFYYKEENEEKTLISISPAKSVEITYIDTALGDNVVTLNEQEISWYGKDTNKMERISLETDTHILYNGKAIDDALTNLLSPNKFRGVIRLIQSSQDTTLVVEECTTIWATTITRDRYKIYDGLSGEIFEFDPNENSVGVFLNGKSIYFPSIAENSVLTVYESKNLRGKKLIRLNVSDKKIDGMVTAISGDTVYIDEEPYVKSYQATQSFYVGMKGYFLLNDRKELAAYTQKTAKPDYKVGVLTGFEPGEGLSETTHIQIFGESDELMAFGCAKKVCIDGVTVEEKVVLNGNASFSGLNNMNIINSLVRYRVNADNEIVMIDSYLEGAGGQDDTFTRLTNPNTVFQYNGTSMLFVYASNEHSIAPFKDMPKLYGFEESGNVNTLFYGSSLADYADPTTVIDITGEVYCIDGEKPYVSHVIWQNAGGASSWNGPFVVLEKTQIFFEGENAIKIVGKQNNSQKEFYIKDSTYNNSSATMAKVRKILDYVQPGDALSFVSNKDGEIVNCQINFLANGAATSQGGISVTPNKNNGLADLVAVSRFRATIFGEVVDILDDFIKVEYLPGEYEYIKLASKCMRVTKTGNKTFVENNLSNDTICIGDKVLYAARNYGTKVLCVYEHSDLD